MKWRVLLLSHTLDLGGSERQLTEIARALDSAKFEVHCGCMKPGGFRFEELRAAGIPVEVFPMSSFFSLGAVQQSFRLRDYIRTHAIDLVHAFDVPMDIFGVPAARIAFGPKVLSSQRAHRSLTTEPRLTILRMTDRLVDGIVVNCEFVREHLIADERVRPKKMHLCYNGLDLTRFPFRDAGSNSRTDLTIGSVCALRPEKNLSLLIRAFADVHREQSSLRLMLVGSGPEQPTLEALVTSMGLRSAVTFREATRDVAERLQQIDIFVLPSKTEALSNALMEAMASGCAAIASDVGGNPELLGTNERGLLFPSNDAPALTDAIRQLIANHSRRRKLTRAAREFVESRLSIAVSVRRMEKIYSSFLDSK